MTTHKHQLPCAYEWQYFQAGNYAMAIEPSTHHVLGDNAARKRGEMIWLGAGEGRDYVSRFAVLDGATGHRCGGIPHSRHRPPAGR